MSEASTSLAGTGIETVTVRRIATLAEADPRSVCREIRAQLGAGSPVRGAVGERIRAQLKTFRLPPEGARLATRAVQSKKSSAREY